MASASASSSELSKDTMPPLVSWAYARQPEPGSAESLLYTDFLVRKDWI